MLGIDVSWVSTGIVVWDGDKVVHWARFLTNSHSSDGERMHYIVKGIVRAAETYQPDLIVFEGYAFNKHQGAARMGELVGVIKYSLWRRDYTYKSVAPLAVKKFATGSGRADKEEMIRAAREYIPFLENSDIADALHIARWGHANYVPA